METFAYSAAPVPRYLYRTQLPTSRPSVNLQQIRAHGTGNFCLVEKLVVGTPAEQSALKQDLANYVLNGDSRGTSVVAWTSSLIYAIAHARKVSRDFFVNDTGEEGRELPFIQEENIEIFVLDTSAFPQSTFISIWSPEENAPGPPLTTDYVTSDLDIPAGWCARVTLRDLYEAGMKAVIKPYRYKKSENRKKTIEHPFVVEGARATVRDLRDYTSHIAMALFMQQNFLEYPEEDVLNAAVEIAKMFPVQFEVPMLLAFLSVCPHPDVDIIFSRLKHEFGDADVTRSLSDLHLEPTMELEGHRRFAQLAADIKRRQEALDMIILEETLRDTPFKDGGGEDNMMWM